jgi:hypothetical protein
MAPEAPSRASADAAASRAGFDLLPHLAKFLGEPPPLTLLITGASGTGKSILLRTLLAQLPGPRAYVAYRANAGGSAGEQASPDGRPALSLLLVDPGAARHEEPDPAAGEPTPPPSASPATPPEGEALPPLLAETVSRLATNGGGYLVVDSWDPTSEQEFRSHAAGPESIHELSAPVALLLERFRRLPLRVILVVSPATDLGLVSTADGTVELGWEEVEGFRLRVVSIPKLRSTPPPESRYLYALDGGRFYCPPQFPPGFRPPIGPPHPDPAPEEDSLFPGSQPFADAFGRLRFHGLTGLEVPSRFPSLVADVFLYPLVAHTMAIGGRVLWIPSPSSTPQQIIVQLSRFLPPEFLGDRLRVVSPQAPDPSMGALRSVVLLARRTPSEGELAPKANPLSAGPMFPEAYRFLRGTLEGRPSLYVVYLDGLRAIATITGIPLTVETFPLIMGGYTRLPRFHGIGFGRTDDPLTRAIEAGVDTHVRLIEKYGRSVLLGVRPRTSPFLLDWTDKTGRYALVPIR